MVGFLIANASSLSLFTTISEILSIESMSTPRRTPVQERSNDTVHTILEAASGLLGRIPLEQITTSRIALEAGVSIGGLYRFFPDKQAILDAIAVRHVADFQKMVETRLSAADFLDGQGLLGMMIDVYVEFLDARPDFRTLALGRHVSALTRERQLEPGAGPGELVKMFLVGAGGADGGADLDLKLRMAIETGERLIDFAFTQETPQGRARVIDEMKKLLGLYLFRSGIR